MKADYMPEIVMPTEEECDQIAQQVIREVKAVFSSGALLSGATLAEEIAARIRKRIQVSVTVIPLIAEGPADSMPVFLTDAQWQKVARRLGRSEPETIPWGLGPS